MPIERAEPATDPREKANLAGWMDYHRATILLKIDGVSDEDLRRALVPSGTSLLGIVKHLAYAEHYWFTMIFAGGDAGLARPNTGDDWRVADDEPTTDVVALYERMCAASRKIIDGASLDDRARGNVENRRGKAREFNMRWILTHMIEETARHNGHADILREQIDGSTGQ